MNHRTMEYLKNSYRETIHKGNVEFASESPKEDLYIEPYLNNGWKLCSTSGTTYCTGTKQDCLNRKDDLLFYVRTGYEKPVYNHYFG